MRYAGITGLALALVLVAPSVAAESVNLTLNWTPTADHSPFYYAKAQGWYEKAGIDLSIETGKGSGVSSLKVGSGGSPFGIADLATALVARSKGADVVALMSSPISAGRRSAAVCTRILRTRIARTCAACCGPRSSARSSCRNTDCR
jgi:NitT/TauT family transport system substrate-binding protein